MILDSNEILKFSIIWSLFHNMNIIVQNGDGYVDNQKLEKIIDGIKKYQTSH